MAKLVYTAIASLDGYVADKEGKFDWAMPDDEVFRFVNDLERPIGTYLYGRRMYETMVGWETMNAKTATEKDFAHIWRAAEKVVYSRTLASVTSTKTRIEPALNPPAVREMKAMAKRDLTVGGPELAGQMLEAGLVDEIAVFACPIIIGGGNRWLPEEVKMPLKLVHERRFGNGVVYQSYRTGTPILQGAK